MAARTKGHGAKYDWDPTRNSFNSSMHESQFDDDEDNDNTPFDYTRLYITNIPKALNEDGLRAAFSKFGTLKVHFMSRDPQRKFGIIKYDTASEAKLAMMKMNRTEPLKLHISIAYKPGMKPKRENQTEENQYEKDDTASVVSRVRSVRKEDLTNGGLGGPAVEDKSPAEETSFSEPMDPNLNLELESLKLEQLKLKEQQLLCKQNMLLLMQAGSRSSHQASSVNRSILPDGRIVIQNLSDRQLDTREGEGNFVAGAGDSNDNNTLYSCKTKTKRSWEVCGTDDSSTPSTCVLCSEDQADAKDKSEVTSKLKIPGLQRVASRSCVQCGTLADAYCARCGVTPYCSELCQRRDWVDRHRTVCHNLARLGAIGGTKNDVEEISGRNSPSTVVHQPQSPPRPPNQETLAPRRENLRPDKENKVLASPEHKGVIKSAPNYRPNSKSTRNSEEKLQEMRRPKAFMNKDQEQEDWVSTEKTFHQQVKDYPQRKPNSGARKLNTPSPSHKANFHPRKNDQETAKALPNPKKEPLREIKTQKPARESDGMKEVPVAVKKNAGQAPGNKNEVSVRQPLLPKMYLIEQLAVGEVAILSVESVASECRSNRPGFICLSMHEKYEADYQRLCEDYGLDCEADGAEYKPNPGESFSYLNPEDGGWYRARTLTPSLAALLDSGRVVTVTTAGAKCKKLPPKYADIPEFCCLLDFKNAKIGSSIKCTLLSKKGNALKVSLQDVESGVDLGEGFISRWLPEVEYPVVRDTGRTKAADAQLPGVPTTEPAVVLPEVTRPPVYDGSRVLLVDATAPGRLVVRPADPHSQQLFDGILQDVLLYGTAASPLTEPPAQGQAVIAKYSDDLHYRALCRRTNVKKDKYQLEYAEYGNIEVSKMERLYPCPARLDLTSVPTLASVVSLGLEATTLTPSAEKYLEDLKDEEMILTLPDKEKSAANGSVVTLTLVKTNEVINRKVEELCTPEWKKLEKRGGDVLEVKKLMFTDLDYMELPASGCTVDVLDDSLLQHGTLYGCETGLPHLGQSLIKLTQRMAEYCNSELGRESYLPTFEELCIARNTQTGEWFRAVMLEQTGGPGGETVSVLNVDCGSFLQVPVSELRKMLPDFLQDMPAAANSLEIRNFPADLSPELTERARRFMGKTSSGQRQLKLINCQMQEPGQYIVDAPELLEAISSV